MNLYELSDSFRQVLELAEDDGIDPQVIKDTLEAIEGEIEYKADGYAKVIKELQADADKLSAEIDRLSKRRISLLNNIKSMKQSLTSAMQITGKTKFKTDLFSFNIQKNPPSLAIDNYDKIPQEFYIPQDPVVNTAAIKELLKAGEVLEYAHLEQGEGVRIR